MTNSKNIYAVKEFDGQPSGIMYFFISEGEKQLVKAVHYVNVGQEKNRLIYNLGFGTYSHLDGSIDDEDISANGDHYKVFNTVLSTVPHFFYQYPGAMVMVQGSDSSIEYPIRCRPACRKKCIPPNCKNVHRRINIYKSYINRNFEHLSEQYKFWGGKIEGDSQKIIEQYQVINSYDSVFLIKK